ncbi:MAG TPA: hypothetical protein PKN54_11120, partial [Candidatus Cloacimonas acidaminovorans]|nr:hypothetical protein [Candidatus Cloacimonas acidaminovorans]
AGKMGWQLPICQGVRSTQRNKCLLFMANHNFAAKMLNLILFSPRLKPLVNFFRYIVISAQAEIQKKQCSHIFPPG